MLVDVAFGRNDLDVESDTTQSVFTFLGSVESIPVLLN